MSGKKSINWSKIGISTWNSVGAKTVKSVFTIASKKLTKELADKAEITAEQTQDITDALADCINYMITQKVNHQHVDNIYLSEMLQSNLIPAKVGIKFLVDIAFDTLFKFSNNNSRLIFNFIIYSLFLFSIFYIITVENVEKSHFRLYFKDFFCTILWINC
jgi:hypothetical protein